MRRGTRMPATRLRDPLTGRFISAATAAGHSIIPTMPVESPPAPSNERTRKQGDEKPKAKKSEGKRKQPKGKSTKKQAKGKGTKKQVKGKKRT
jgi:hypothetical protein